MWCAIHKTYSYLSSNCTIDWNERVSPKHVGCRNEQRSIWWDEFARRDTCFNFTLTRVRQILYNTYFAALCVFVGAINMVNIEPVTIVWQKAGQNSRKQNKIRKRNATRWKSDRTSKNTQFQFDNYWRRRRCDKIQKRAKRYQIYVRNMMNKFIQQKRQCACERTKDRVRETGDRRTCLVKRKMPKTATT